ncbi:MAG: putative glycoside hydrolase [bacterium]|nr:putative glycoside hydrolase [bacterium]
MEEKEKKDAKKSRPNLGLFIGGVSVAAVFVSVAGFIAISPNTFTVERADRVEAGFLGQEELEGDYGVSDNPNQVAHMATPFAVKAIYMTSCVAGTPSFREKLVTLVDETELNSIIIDIKDYTGRLSFFPDDPKLYSAVSDRCRAPDMKEFIDYLHKKGIYVIGRITVFQDPYLANLKPELAVKKASDGSIWKDYKGLSFTDPGAKDVWEYTVDISRASYSIGFDELNFDYIRYPSDGPMKDIYFPWSNGKNKADVLESFFSFLRQELSAEGIIISADLFGMTTVAYSGFDLNIGQVLEKAAPYFDYVSPMVYPSHYPSGFNGWGNPNHYPYEVVKYSMDEALKKLVATTTTVRVGGAEPISTTTPLIYRKLYFGAERLRPWLQDFDYGGDYDIEEVRAQIQATYDAGLNSWMLWSPSNVYTRDALLAE